MMWTKKKLGDLCDITRGSSPRPIDDPHYFEDGTIPWVKIADATKAGKFLYETKEHVNEFGASFSRFLPAGTILVAASGTLGYVQILGVNACAHDGWLIIQNLRELDRDFAYYALQTMQQHFLNNAYGAAIQNINTAILRETEIPYPPLITQTKIGEILSAYDDLIENNARRIALLEEAMRLLYREWFVRLRFPGCEGVKVVEGVPEGWKRKTLGDIVLEMRRQLDPSDVEPDVPYVGLEHIPRQSIALMDWGKAGDVTSSKFIDIKKKILTFCSNLKEMGCQKG